MRSEAQRRALNKYNAKTYRTAAVKLTVAEYNAVQAAAQSNGLTVNALLKRLLFDYIAECPKQATEQPEN